MRPPVRVLIVARLPLARAGLAGLLAESDGLTMVGEALSIDDASARLAGDAIDIALGSWDSTQFDELKDLAEAAAEAGTGLVLLGTAPTADQVTALLAAGMRGFLLDDATADDVRVALESVAHGLVVLDPVLSRNLGAVPPEATAPDLEMEQLLTAREREVLDLLATGLPNKIIARRLQISEHTVKFHVASILGKLGAASRTEAVTRAIQRGLLAI
jgi:DNA-binding NarL/FixJ family response regulator